MRWLGVGLLLLLTAGLGVAAAVVLALGSLLARLFAVTPFEASVVVLGVAVAGGIWLGIAAPGGEDAARDPEDEDRAIILEALPIPTRRGPRRRKRTEPPSGP
jgi:hypothetical protein